MHQKEYGTGEENNVSDNIKFYKKNDNYYIQNEDITSFIFTVSKLKNCVNFEEISKVEIQPGKILKISLERDGIYTVLIDDTDSILIKDYLL